MCAVADRAVGEGQKVIVGVAVVTLVGGVSELCRKNCMGKCCVLRLRDFVEFTFFEGVAIDDAAISKAWYSRVGLKFGIVVARAFEGL